MVTALYLIRHGETEGSEIKRYKGSIDVPLSEKGIEQIKKVAVFIKEHLRLESSAKYQSYLRDIHSKKSAEARIHPSQCYGEWKRGSTPPHS
ncbi:MAG: phosphoglycerate mutase family protein, partial [Nitrospirota bacterium]